MGISLLYLRFSGLLAISSQDLNKFPNKERNPLIVLGKMKYFLTTFEGFLKLKISIRIWNRLCSGILWFSVRCYKMMKPKFRGGQVMHIFFRRKVVSRL